MYHSKRKFRLGTDIITQEITKEIADGIAQNYEENKQKGRDKYYHPSYWCGNDIDYISYNQIGNCKSSGFTKI